jgi:hypothetical protein
MPQRRVSIGRHSGVAKKEVCDCISFSMSRFRDNLLNSATVLALWLGTVLPAQAHGPFHEQIATLNANLIGHPGDTDLLLRRAELYRLHEDWILAEKDIASAVQAGAAKGATSLARARLAATQQKWDAAAAEIPVFTTELAENGSAWRLAATIHLARHEREAATEALRQTIAQASPTQPDDFTRFAEALAQAGRREEAVTILDTGLQTLGPVSSMLELAAKLEVELRRFDAALARFDAAAARTANPAYWLARKADAAEQAGRAELAAEARAAAILAIESLPDARRHTVAMAELERRLRAALAQSIPDAAATPR